LDQRGGFTQDGVWRGVKAALAITLGLSPFGLVVGMTADQVGLSLAETLLMSATVFAGTSQLVALQLWAEPAPVLAATLACLVINLRLAPMGAALAPVLDRTSGLRRWGTLALLVDNSFALAITGQARDLPGLSGQITAEGMLRGSLAAPQASLTLRSDAPPENPGFTP
jgi:predicted branched-subunit amino acid permease